MTPPQCPPPTASRPSPVVMAPHPDPIWPLTSAPPVPMAPHPRSWYRLLRAAPHPDPMAPHQCPWPLTPPHCTASPVPPSPIPLPDPTVPSAPHPDPDPTPLYRVSSPARRGASTRYTLLHSTRRTASAAPGCCSLPGRDWTCTGCVRGRGRDRSRGRGRAARCRGATGRALGA